LFRILEDAKKFDEVISLGGNCDSAQHWRRYSGREYAFPFDFWVTPFESVDRLITERFAHVFLNQNMAVIDSGDNIMCRRYGVGHVHDFPRLPSIKVDQKKIFEFCVSNQEKYAALAKRFFDACRPGRRILFIRSWRDSLWAPPWTQAPDSLTRYDFDRFIAALEYGLPGCDFQVLFVNYGVQRSSNFRAMFHEIKDHGDITDWSGSALGWDEMFRQFID